LRVKTMTKNHENEVNPARFAELELENEELKEKLAQREHDTAEIADALEAAQRNGGGSPVQPRVYLISLWGLIVLTLFSCVLLGPLGGIPGLVREVLFIGFSFVLLGKWLVAERRGNAGVFVVKLLVLAIGLFIAALIASEGRVVEGHMEPVLAPFWAVLWVSFLMAVMLSPFCMWVARSVAQFVRHPIETSRMMFRREGQRESEGESEDESLGDFIYDGRGEN